MNTVKPGYKTTEGILSFIALIGSALVALKWVPITVNTEVQADAIKAIPLITGLYSIARGIAKAFHPALPVTTTPAPTVLPPSEADQAPGL